MTCGEGADCNAFHYKEYIFFKRLENGDVRIYQKNAVGTTIWSMVVDNASWASVVSHVSFNADRPEAYQRAYNLHNQDEF